jgi:hypothetical protein
MVTINEFVAWSAPGYDVCDKLLPARASANEGASRSLERYVQPFEAATVLRFQYRPARGDLDSSLLGNEG